MTKENSSKGVWDDPIPEAIADAISESPSSNDKLEIAPPPEFNPAFNSTLFSSARREKPMVRKRESAHKKNNLDTHEQSQYIPENNTEPSFDSASPSDEQSNPEFYDDSNVPIVSAVPDADTIEKSPIEPETTLGKKSLFGNIDKFSKPKIIRASIKSVFPHIALCITCVLLALFPSLAINFLGEDLQTMPDTIVENMPVIVGVFFILLAVFILVIMAKQMATGSLWLYEGHVKFKKGLLESETHYYGNLQTVEAERTLSSMWSDTGDLVLLHPKGSITMHNVLHPFQVRDDIREQINLHRNR